MTGTNEPTRSGGDIGDHLRIGMRILRTAWMRFAGLFLATSTATLVGFFALMGLLSHVVAAQRGAILDGDSVTTEGIIRLVVQVALPIAAMVVLSTAVTIASVASMADDVLAGRPARVTSALVRGFRRGPATLGAAGLALLGVGAAFVLAPVVVLAGVVALVLGPLARRLASRWSPLERWPSTGVALRMLIPFRPVARALVRWGLFLPASSLELNGPRAALRRSRTVVRMHSRQVALVLGCGLGLYWGVQVGFALLGRTWLGGNALTAVQIVTQLLTAALPPALAVVLFRALAGPSDPDLAVPAPSSSRPPRLAATATVLPVAILASTLVTGVWTGAGATPVAVAGTPRADSTFVVDDLGDEADADPGDGECATDSGMCTLRAAIAESNAVGAEPYGDLPVVGFALGGVIVTGEPMVVTAPVVIDGEGSRVTVTSRECEGCAQRHQLVRVTETGEDVTIRNITLDGGLAGAEGGGAVEVWSRTVIDRVALTGNHSPDVPGGAVVVHAGEVWVQNSTFVGNSAPSGADVATASWAGVASVQYSTLIGGTGSSLAGDGGFIGPYYNIISTTTLPSCTGTIWGGTNLADDEACESLGPVTGLGPFGDHGGWTNTVALEPSSPAVDGGSRSESCSGEDGRGVTRPQGARCDLGAFELEVEPLAPLVVDDLGDEPDAAPGDGACATTGGACTLRAAFEEVDGAGYAPEAIHFDVDGTITVSSPLVTNRPLVVDGSGRRVAISGGGTTRIFEQHGSWPRFELRRLHLRDGASPDFEGGGAVESQGNLIVDSVTFEGNSTDGEGGAVLARGESNEITNSSFVDNRASVGADVAAEGDLLVRNVTSVGGQGGSIHVVDWVTASVSASIVAPDDGAACVGVDHGLDNLAPDGTCPGTTVTSLGGIQPLGDYGGPVPTVAIDATSAAFDAALSGCEQVDARGVARPQGHVCDIGSFELVASIPTTVEVATSPSPSAYGVDVLVAAEVRDDSDGVPLDGSVTFSIGEQEVGVGWLQDGVATATLHDLPPGTHRIVASFSGSGHHQPSQGQVDHVVESPSTVVEVRTVPASSTFGEVVGVEVSVGHPGAPQPATGTVELRRDGDLVASGELSAGTVTFADVGRLPAGTSNFVASYAGDERYPAAIGSTSHVVGATTGQVNLTVGSAPSRFGQMLTLHAEVTGLWGTVPGTGQVAFSSGAVHLGTATLDGNGVAELTVDDLPVGTHEIRASFEGSAELTPAEATRSHEVIPASTVVSLTSTKDPSVVGLPVELTAKVGVTAPGGGVPVGVVTFYDGVTELGSEQLVDGEAAIVVDLPVGIHSVIAVYDGSASHGSSAGSHVQTVVPASTLTSATAPTSSVVGEGVAVAVEVTRTDEGGGVPTGTIRILVGEQEVTSALLEVDGTATLDVSGLGVGSHELTVTYDGEASFEGSGTSFVHEVSRAGTSLAVDAFPATVSGQVVDVAVRVSVDAPGRGAPTGTVELRSAGVLLGSAPLDADGVALVPARFDRAGAHELVASYLGDDSFTASSTQLDHEVGRAGTTVALEVLDDPVLAGAPVRIRTTVVVAAPGSGTPGGTVQVLVDGAPEASATVVGGLAEVQLEGLGAGTRELEAVYAGDAERLGSTSPTIQLDVQPAGATVTLRSDLDDPVRGQAVTFTASVVAHHSGVEPTGSVVFSIGGVPVGTGSISDGEAHLTVSDLPAGSHVVVASYVGDGTVGGGVSAPHTQSVLPAATAVTLETDPASPVVGQAVTVTAEVRPVAPGAGSPGGTVVYLHGGVEVGRAQVSGTSAQVVIAGLPVGPADLVARYEGDGQFESGEGTLRVTVSRGTSSVEVSADRTSAARGEAVTLTAAVAAVPPGAAAATGSVTFLADDDVLGSAPLDGGTATLPVTSLGVGVHEVVAVWSGDASLLGSLSSPVVVTITRASASVAVGATPATAVAGESVALVATLSSAVPATGSPDGTVTFSAAGVDLGAAVLVDGVATLATTDLPVGAPSVTATYGGSEDHLGAVGSTTVEVSKASSAVALSVDPPTAVVGQDVELSASVSSIAPSSLVPGGTVTFSSGGLELGTATLVDGSASLVVSDLAVGAGTVTATYSGSSTHQWSAGAADVVVEAAPTAVRVEVDDDAPVVGRPVVLTVDVEAVSPGVGHPSGTVEIIRLGAPTPEVVGSGELADGRVVIAVEGLAVGSHQLAARWGGDSSYLGATSAPVAVTVLVAESVVTIAATPLPAVWGQPVTFEATVAGPQGLGVPTGRVDFRAGAELLGSAQLDQTGTASITVGSLAVGTRNVVAAYEGDDEVGPGASGGLVHEVVPAGTTTGLSVTTASSELGTAIELEAEVLGVAPGGAVTGGTVSFRAGPVLLGTSTVGEGGSATLVTSGLPIGLHQLTATFEASATHQASTSTPAVHEVVAASSSTVLTTGGPTERGGPVELTATVSGRKGSSDVPTGTVTFHHDGAAPSVLGSSTLDEEGVARFTVVDASILESFTVGSVPLRAVYGGDGSHGGSQGTADHEVVRARTVTEIDVPSVHPGGEWLEVAVSVSSTHGTVPSGTVVLVVDGTEHRMVLPASGDLLHGFTPVAGGSVEIEASYEGDADHEPSAAPTSTVEVARIPTTTTLTGSSGVSVWGQPVTFTATVTGPSSWTTPVGEVVILDGGTEVARSVLTGGRADLVLSDLPVGSTSLRAEFRDPSASPTFAGSTSEPRVHVVAPARTTTHLTTAPTSSVLGEEVRLAALVEVEAPGGAPRGTVTFASGADVLGAAVVAADGTASIRVDSLGVGVHDVEARFTGAGTHQASTATVEHRVDRAATAVSVTSDPVSSVTGQTVTFTAEVAVSAPGNAPLGGTGGGTVTFSGLFDRTVPVDEHGRASVAVAVPTAADEARLLTAAYSGDARTAPSSVQGSHRIDRAATTTTLSIVGDTERLVAGEDLELAIDVAPVAPGAQLVPRSTATLLVRVDGRAIASLPVEVPGRATTTLASPAQLSIGSRAVTAEVVVSDGYQASSSAPTVVEVVPAAASVTLSRDVETSVLGQPVRFSADVRAPEGITPTGVVQLVVDGAVVAQAAVGNPLVHRDLPVGGHEVVARFRSSSPVLNDADSAPLVHVVAPTPTTTAFVDDFGSPAGMPIRWTVEVRADQTWRTARPVGHVELLLGEEVVATAPLNVNVGNAASRASFTTGALPGGSHAVTARYVPSSDHAPSSVQGVREVVRSDVTLTLSARGRASTEWGRPVPFDVRVLRRTDVPAPTGQIRVGAGGASCVVPATGGTCELTWPLPGRHVVTATYEGDDVHRPSTSNTAAITVDKRTPTLTGTVGTTRPETGVPVPLSWQLRGPEAAELVASIGDARCVGGVEGTCTGTYSWADGDRMNLASVTYAGDAHWRGVTWSEWVQPVSCHAFPVTVTPPGSGTAVTTTPRNCGGGTGYLTGTTVQVVATPAPSGVASFDWELAYMYPGRPDALVQQFRVGRVQGQTTDVLVEFRRAHTCVTVTLRTELAPNTHGSIRPTVEPDCPIDAGGSPVVPRWEHSYGVATGRFTRGATVGVEARTITPNAEVYGFRGFGEGSEITPAVESFTADRDRRVVAVMGPRCYLFDTTAVGPGSAEMTSPENCHDPRGWSGWLFGSTVRVQAVTEPMGYVESLDGAWLSSTSTCEDCGPDGGRGRRFEAVVPAVDPHVPRTVAWSFGECRRLEIQSRRPGGYPPVIETTPSANCPVEPAKGWDDPGYVTHWYLEGTEVTATSGGQDNMGKWNPEPADVETQDEQDRIDVRMDRDRILRPSRWSPGIGCSTIELRTEPAGWVEAEVSNLDADLDCPARGLRGGPGVSADGLFRTGQAMQVELTGLRGDPLLGWSFERSTDGGFVDAVEGATATHSPGGFARVTAVACQGIEPVVNLETSDGKVVSGAPPDGDFIAVDPAPDCPYRENAWVVGTTVRVAGLADPTGYTFIGWGGAANGSDFISEVVLDGSSQWKTVEADYEVVCHRLTLTNDHADVTKYPEPNCPGSSGDTHESAMYLGGTLVLLHGRVPGGKVWQGWKGDVQPLGKVNPTSVVMDGDKTASHRWRSKDWDEKAVDFFEDIGDAIVDGVEWLGDQTAILGKKLVGVLALAVHEVVNGAPPLSIVGMVVSVLDVVDMTLRAMGVDSDMGLYLRYAQETMSLLMGPLTCGATWSFAGNQSGSASSGADWVDGADALHDYYRIATTPGVEETEAALREFRRRRTFQLNQPVLGGLPPDLAYEETTGLATRARIGFAKLNVAKAKAAPLLKAPAMVGIGLTAYDIYSSGPGFGWDDSAEEAWTNGSAYHDCMERLLPSYLPVQEEEWP